MCTLTHEKVALCRWCVDHIRHYMIPLVVSEKLDPADRCEECRKGRPQGVYVLVGKQK